MIYAERYTVIPIWRVHDQLEFDRFSSRDVMFKCHLQTNERTGRCNGDMKKKTCPENTATPPPTTIPTPQPTAPAEPETETAEGGSYYSAGGSYYSSGGGYYSAEASTEKPTPEPTPNPTAAPVEKTCKDLCGEFRNGANSEMTALCLGPKESWGRPCYPLNHDGPLR